MAKDLYESRQMYQGPGMFFLLIPVGMVLLFVLFDFGYKLYNEYKLNQDTKDILYKMMESTQLETKEDYKLYAQDEYKKLGYETKDVSVIMEENSIILINYAAYFSMIDTVNIFKDGNEKIAVARFRGYYNEYKETVIEEIEEGYEEPETENDDGIIIMP